MLFSVRSVERYVVHSLVRYIVRSLERSVIILKSAYVFVTSISPAFD